MGVPCRAAIKHTVITSLMLVKVAALRRHLTPAREDHTMLGIGFQAKGTVPWPPCPTHRGGAWCPQCAEVDSADLSPTWWCSHSQQ